MEVQFVLVEPAVPEHVGFIARALKTMGFSALRLVNSEAHREERAQWVAHGSRDILEGALVFSSLQEAVQDADFIVATTARRRTLRHDYHSPSGLRLVLREKQGWAFRISLVFGREESGLTNEELSLAHCVSSIPMAVSYPSLNLSQAVLIYAYELSPLTREISTPLEKIIPDGGLPSATEPLTYRALRERIERIFPRIGFAGSNLVGKRLLERLALLSAPDLRLVHSLCDRLEKALSTREDGP